MPIECRFRLRAPREPGARMPGCGGALPEFRRRRGASKRHAEPIRTPRALARFSPRRQTVALRARARDCAGAAAIVAAVGCNRRGEERVKARDIRRPLRRRTPEELAREHEDALRWRARLRAEEAGEVIPAEISAPPAAADARERSGRSRFAAAITRAEFGRFYFKEMPPGRRPTPRRGRNGQAK